MRDDGLFLKLELLESVGLENLLDFCTRGMSVVNSEVFREGAELTHRVVLVGTQRQRQKDSVRGPFALGDGASQNDQTGGDVNTVKVLAGSESVGHDEGYVCSSSPQ